MILSPGTWQLPGGHLEFRESTAACAERETKEETALDVAAEKFVKMTEDVFESDGKHYITLFMSCRMADPGATPQVSACPERLWDAACDGLC